MRLSCRFNLGIIPSSDCDDDIDEHAKTTFEVGGLAISQEVPHDQNGQHKQNDHEDLEVQAQFLPKTPGHNNCQWCIQQGSLD